VFIHTTGCANQIQAYFGSGARENMPRWHEPENCGSASISTQYCAWCLAKHGYWHVQAMLVRYPSVTLLVPSLLLPALQMINHGHPQPETKKCAK